MIQDVQESIAAPMMPASEPSTASFTSGIEFGHKALKYNDIRQKYEITNLRPILDFGIGFEYFINDHFTAFANINNIACQHYMRYYDYPNLGINGVIGCTYLFGNESIKRTKKSKQ